VEKGGGAIGEGHDLWILREADFAVIDLQMSGQRAALAALMSGHNTGEFLWKELLRIHLQMSRPLSSALPDALREGFPDTQPWIQISLAPAYVEQVSAARLHTSLSQLWAAAFAFFDWQCTLLPLPSSARN